jgi:hypothetical protein
MAAAESGERRGGKMERGRRTWSGWRGSCQPCRRRQRGHDTAVVVLSPPQRIVVERFDPSALPCSALLESSGGRASRVR